MRKVLGTFAVILAVSVPVVGAAQSPTPLPEGAAELMMEIQEIQGRLSPIQSEAMADPELQAAGEELGARIREVMAERRPETEELISRLQELAPQIEEAQANGNTARFSELVQEYGYIDQALQITRDEVTREPAIDALVVEYEKRVQAKMVEDNPEVAEMLDRLQTLSGQLAAMLRESQGRSGL